MADISSKLDKIKSAERGEDVRDAIIGALRDINNDVPADMSNPERVTADMPGGSDLTIPFNPPKLVSEIYVRQAGSGGKSTTLKDITITENGEYPTDEEDYDSSTENRYYKKVKVKVPQLANQIEMDEVVIEQNGTYSATEWGVDGLRTITVNVQAAAGDGPFQVEFYDKVQTDPTATVKETQLVPKGGSAVSSYQPVSPIGQMFVGWNPSPVNVTRDMKCYPRFSDKQVVLGEIPDDWGVILQKKGMGYPLGSYKNLAYGVTFTPDEMRSFFERHNVSPSTLNLSITFTGLAVKVAEGEGGTNSSWLWQVFESADDSNISHIPDSGWRNRPVWKDDLARYFLNEMIYTHMSDAFKAAIKPVTKYANYSDANHPPYSVVGVEDYVWIPSIKEMISTDEENFWTQSGNCIIDQYGEEPIETTCISKYYTNVPNAIAYFRDNLELTKDERDALLLRATSDYHTLLRDYGHGPTNLGYTGAHKLVQQQRKQCQIFTNEYWDGNVIFGFCL